MERCCVSYDNALIASKLRRWEKYLKEYSLPLWEDIPNFGLYMEQVLVLLKEYLDYLPPELKDEQLITAAAINNYVRNKYMPEPKKKRSPQSKPSQWISSFMELMYSISSLAGFVSSSLR